MNAVAARQNGQEPNAVSLGQLFRDARKRKGLSPQKVANDANVNVNSLMKYERAGEDGGVFPPFDKAARLCAVLDIDPFDLFAEVARDQSDTAAFYRDRPLGRVGEAATQSDVAKARELIAEATKLLRRVGGDAPRVEAAGERPEAGADRDDDTESARDDEPETYESGIARISQMAREQGIASRALHAELVEFRQHVLKPMEYEELYSRALDGDLDLSGIPEPNAQSALPTKERARMEDALESYLLCDAIYRELWRNLDADGFARAANKIKSDCYDGRAFVSGQGIFEGDKDYLARLRREISPHLVCAIETRSAVALESADKKAAAAKPEKVEKPASGDKAKRKSASWFDE